MLQVLVNVWMRSNVNGQKELVVECGCDDKDKMAVQKASCKDVRGCTMRTKTGGKYLKPGQVSVFAGKQ